jgi:hypothetical protein
MQAGLVELRIIIDVDEGRQLGRLDSVLQLALGSNGG